MGRSLTAVLSIVVLAGCESRNRCYETCYRSVTARAETTAGTVEFVECQGDLEPLSREEFSDCTIVGKSYFSAPFAKPDDLKRFAARKGANVVLCARTLERAGLQHECRCNPVQADDTTVTEEPEDPNVITFTSVSASAQVSSAVGPGATYIFSHEIWFLYRDKQE